MNVSSQKIRYGELGLQARFDEDVGFSQVVQRIQLDVQMLASCVQQTLESFSQCGGNVSLLHLGNCQCYCAQAMTAATVLSMGGYEESLAAHRDDLRDDMLSAKLDERVRQEMFRIGLFDVQDSHSTRAYKHHVFMQSWEYCLQNQLLRTGAPLLSSVGRVCGSQWVDEGFDPTIYLALV